MICVEDITLNFGGLKAVDGVSLEVDQGSITGLIGPNGAGKTTLFNVIAGSYMPTSGLVWLNGEDITGLQTFERFNKGLLRTFQIAHEFPSMTVRENLMMVPPNQSGERIINTWIRRSQIRQEEKVIREKAEDVLEFLQLKQLANERAGNLSGGQKKLLELGRTMMVDAKMVLLDEVGAGVNRTLLNRIGDTILRLNQEHSYTFFMIEHDFDFIASLCNSVIVMAEGKLLTQGTPEEVKQNDDVLEAYLGRAHNTQVVDL
tara:strand:- start:171 stop:950 length:780 start_codon:yes stop_codon:yes gene_type:complete